MAKPDWEAIESAYRAGSLSVRAIGEKHGVNHATILKRASKEGWQRDLAEKVRNATKAKLIKSVTTSVTRDGNRSPVVTDDEIVDQASDEAVSVVKAHSEGLAAWRGITNNLRDFLEGAEITDENHGAISRSINSGVDAQIKVINAERKAYNLDTEQCRKVGGIALNLDSPAEEAKKVITDGAAGLLSHDAVTSILDHITKYLKIKEFTEIEQRLSELERAQKDG